MSKMLVSSLVLGAVLSASCIQSVAIAARAVSGIEDGAVATAAPSVALDDPIAHYRTYEAAIARGDTLAASQAAVLAWQTGERVWNGQNPNLPGLAFNAAWSLGLANKITEAQAPARRAVALAAENPSSVDPKEAAFLLAYANMMVVKSKPNLEAFSRAARAIDNGGWGDFLLTRAYVDGSVIALDLYLPRTSRDLVDRGLAEATRIAPGNDSLRTNLLIIRTQSSLRLGEYIPAVREAMDARRSYGVPKGERDLNWASLAAWEAASRAVYESVRVSRMSTGSRLTQSDDFAEWDKEELKALSGQPAECVNLDIKRRGRGGSQGIAFPTQEQRDMTVGGAYVRARLDGQGKVINADVLASLPRPAFGEAAQAGIKDWRYDLPPGTPIQCQFVDVVVMYSFLN